MSRAQALYDMIRALVLCHVTNITLTGSAMVNWNRRLLIQGVTTVIMVSIHAMDQCFGYLVP